MLKVNRKLYTAPLPTSFMLIFTAVRRDQLTPVAFGLIKVEVNGKGSVTAKLNTGLSSKLHVRYFLLPFCSKMP